MSAKFLFNASLVVGFLSIVLMTASISINQPVLLLINAAILAISIICALLNLKMLP